MIAQEDFIPADPALVAPALGTDIHLWRLPYAPAQGRAPLLGLLAAYLDVGVAAIALREDRYGKPHLVAPGPAQAGSGFQPLQFNWSHSGGHALLAVARGIAPGVDIEQWRDGVRTIELAQRFFAASETEALSALPQGERGSAFLRLWCAKEAVLKALGRGLAFGLEKVAFESADSGWRPAVFDPAAGAASDWHVLALIPAPGCFGALAWRGDARAVKTWCQPE